MSKPRFQGLFSSERTTRLAFIFGMTVTLVVYPDVVKAELPAGSRVLSAELLGVPDLGPVKLKEGRWEGGPYAAGGSSRPTVTVVRDFFRAGDADRDGRPDTLFFLEVQYGGSGSLRAMALLIAGPLKKVHAAVIGDRVQVRGAEVEHDGTVTLSVVQAGRTDAMCCPGELAERRWTWENGSLQEKRASVTGRLSLGALTGSRWQLDAWGRSEPADTLFPVSMEFDSGRVSGRSGCNRYFAGVAEGDSPGAFTIGAAGATRMMCPPEAMRVESRFLSALPAVRRFGFFYGRLFLEYSDGDRPVMLLFHPER